MSRQNAWPGPVILPLLLALGWSRPLLAQPAPDPPSPDKSGYTILQPTPDSALRDMDTDRPNHTNTPHTIDAGHVQVEIGWADFTHTHDRTDGADTVTDMLALGQFNVRAGITNTLEVNVALTAWEDQHTTDRRAGTSSRDSGFGDLFVGLKRNLWGDDGSDGAWSTAFALQPQVKIPTAEGSLGNGHVEIFVGAPLLVNLPYGIHLGLETNVSAQRDAANTGEVAGWQNSASIDRTLIGKADVYLEYWSEIFSGGRQPAQQTLDVGFTYPLTERLQLDAGVNVGLSRASPGIEGLTGLSVRY